MRKLLVLVFVSLLPIAAFAQSTDIQSLKGGFDTFATDVADSLPLNAAVGLNWSSAYIGQFPHLGLGATLGFSTIPYATVESLGTAIGININTLIPSSALTYIQKYGVPFPAYTVDARLGGIALPFDLGVKFGYVGNKLPASITSLLNGIDLNYMLLGADIRVPLLKEGFLLPGLSVGGGFNYLQGSLGMPSSSQNISLASFTYNSNTYNITMTSPALNLNWDAKVIDFKAQLSKHILLFTPYIGIGASKGFEDAGGSISSSLQVNGNPPSSLTTSQKNDINSYLTSQGMQTIDWSNPNPSIGASSAIGGWSFRAFGGTSIDLLILHLDLGVMYDFLGHNYGGSVNVRLQF